MSAEERIRDALREWVAKTSGTSSIGDIADDTPIFRSGILKSVQVTDLILYIEELAKRRVDVEKIKPGGFRDINSIYINFFSSDHV